MTNWKVRVKLTHLYTEKEDYDSIAKSMSAIADVLKKEPCFAAFSTDKFKKIPKTDDDMISLVYANRLLDKMYDYADSHLIWIE